MTSRKTSGDEYLNPRGRAMWEKCRALPFSTTPTTTGLPPILEHWVGVRLSLTCSRLIPVTVNIAD